MFERYCRSLWQNILQEALRQSGLSSDTIVLDAQELTVHVIPERDSIVHLVHLTEALYNIWLRRRRANGIKAIPLSIAFSGVSYIIAACLFQRTSELVTFGVSALPYAFFIAFGLWRTDCEYKACRLSLRSAFQALCALLRQRSRLTETEWQLLLKLLSILPRTLCYSLSWALVPFLEADVGQDQQDEGRARLLGSAFPSLCQRLSKFSSARDRLPYPPQFVLAALNQIDEGSVRSQELYTALKRLGRVFKGEEIGEVAERLLAEWSRERLKAEEAMSLGRAASVPHQGLEKEVLLRGHLGGLESGTKSELLRPHGHEEP